MVIEMEFGALSDTGCVRANNEDSYCAAPELNLFILSDGMGGLESGEVASRLAADTILAHVREADANPSLPLAGEPIDGVSEISNRLAGAVRLANQAVHNAALNNSSGQPMGATVVVVQLVDERMSFAHVGDSRIYRLRGNDLEQLTQDHSFVAEQVRNGRMTPEEARTSKLQNVLLRGLGIDATVEVDVNEELAVEGDTILLCSDALTRDLSDDQIAAVLRENEDSQETAKRLIEMAKQAGGGDNITAIVVRLTEKLTGRFSRIGKWFKESA
jgi:serine/threonine protein phosphatase PrpC